MKLILIGTMYHKLDKLPIELNNLLGYINELECVICNWQNKEDVAEYISNIRKSDPDEVIVAMDCCPSDNFNWKTDVDKGGIYIGAIRGNGGFLIDADYTIYCNMSYVVKNSINNLVDFMSYETHRFNVDELQRYYEVKEDAMFQVFKLLKKYC